jgi:5'-nucleotidase
MESTGVRRGAWLWKISVVGVLALGGCIDAHAEPPSRSGGARAPVAVGTGVATRPVTISVVATNDVHGRLSQLPLFGGYVRNVRDARAADGGGVLLLDAGDIFQGTLASCLSEGASMIRGYRALGYTAAAVGNHEFDFGPIGPAPIPRAAADDPFGALRARVADAGFPFLCSNLRARDGSVSPLTEVRPSLLTEVAGVKVGLVGGLTEHALTATHGANVTGLAMLPLVTSVATEARALRAQGAQLVIALIHAGGDCTRVDDPDDLSSCDEGEAFEFARGLAALAAPAANGKLSPPPVDLILGGHTHAFVAHRVAGIPIIESGANGHAFGRVDFTFQPGASPAWSYKIFPPHELCEDRLDKPVCATERYEGKTVERDPRVLDAIRADLDHADLAANEPIGVEVTSLIKRSSEVESPLTNLVVDLMLRAVPGAQAAFNNPGSVRIPLPTGPLTYGRMFEMFPFENRFAKLRMKASDLAKVVQNSLESTRGLVTLAGVRAAASCKAGKLTISLTTPDGKPMPAGRKLTVVTSDYVAETGDGLMRGIKLPKNAVTIAEEPFIRDALITGLRKGGATLDGNDPALYDAANPRLRYVGPRPISCLVN